MQSKKRGELREEGGGITKGSLNRYFLGVVLGFKRYLIASLYTDK